MAGPTGGRYTAASGKRGYYLYEFGTHIWVPQTEADFSLGMFRDTARVDIPAGGVYDSADYMLHKPGVAFKRGGTSYFGLSASGALGAVAYANFPGVGGQLVACFGGTLVLLTAGAKTTLPAVVSTGNPIEKPKLFIGGALNLLVFTDPTGANQPSGYDGTTIVQGFLGGTTSLTLTVAGGAGAATSGTFKLMNPDTGVKTSAIQRTDTAGTIQTALTTAFGGTWVCGGGPLQTAAVTITRPASAPLAVSDNTLAGGTSSHNVPVLAPAVNPPTDVPYGTYSEAHLSRIVLANSATNPNRLWFSPLVDIQSTAWDMSNAYFDFPGPISGLASLGSTLLVFMQDRLYRLDGDTPPPGTNMSIRPVGTVGCTDARSITVLEGKCYFANPTGVYVTSGTGADSLMKGRIESYWRSLFTGYASTWTIATGIYGRRFLFVTVLDNNSALVATLMCDLDRGAWVRHTAPVAKMYASVYGAQEELYSANPTVGVGQVEQLSGMFSPTASNKNDANGTAVTPLLETRPFAPSPHLAAFGHGKLHYDMRDAASDNPTMAVSTAPGVEATTYTAVPESPLAENTDEAPKRFSVNTESRAVSLKLQQANASSKTEIYAAEIEVRGFPQAKGDS